MGLPAQARKAPILTGGFVSLLFQLEIRGVCQPQRKRAALLCMSCQAQGPPLASPPSCDLQELLSIACLSRLLWSKTHCRTINQSISDGDFCDENI